MSLPNPVEQKSYDVINNKLSLVMKEVAEESMKRAAVEENSSSPYNLLTVSGDGTWETRGHSSLIGGSLLGEPPPLARITLVGDNCAVMPDGRGYELVSSVRALVPQKVSVEEELMHVKHVDVKSPHVGVMWKFGRGVISSEGGKEEIEKIKEQDEERIEGVAENFSLISQRVEDLEKKLQAGGNENKSTIVPVSAYPEPVLATSVPVTAFTGPVKLSTYDGKTNWEVYKTQFAIISETNG
ncbi:hypothetical protein TNCV_3216481 [Trichonephila clavipes]|nr:hypothetical protein TNCV_3216481 [Trichonephila clavipes]